MEVLTFTCSICGEDSRDICVSCTKDTCSNHLCERCKQCSDCCVCEVRLVADYPHTNGKVFRAAADPESHLTSIALSADEFGSTNN